MRYCLAARCKRDASQLVFGFSLAGRPHIAAGISPREEQGAGAAITAQLRGDFNVCHSGEHVVLVWPNCRTVGIDIERHRSALEVRKLFALAVRDDDLCEVKRRGQRGENEFFFDIWATKEALLKARGLGITVGPERFSVASRRVARPSSEETAILLPSSRMIRAAWICTVAGYSACVAWERRITPQ
ncbi:4'-phosphopantetheinyl transferase family protein [Paraburkholderia humisilvae]|uniref:4'-phosphopantetheinyl transferase family protein n=1 Tax=Paraburkholderia humisilvae TaxID=627669 RepID=UPI001581E05F